WMGKVCFSDGSASYKDLTTTIGVQLFIYLFLHSHFPGVSLLAYSLFLQREAFRKKYLKSIPLHDYWSRTLYLFPSYIFRHQPILPLSKKAQKNKYQSPEKQMTGIYKLPLLEVSK
ncbi:MAG: hypothetical protein ACYT04_82995, partial [Nostoc sp.]